MPSVRRTTSLALAAVLAGSLVCTASAEDQPAPLKFAWPVPSKARVTEKFVKAGHSATRRFSVSLERSGDAGDLRVHLSDFEFVDFDGKPATEPMLAQQAQQGLKVANATPDVLVGPDGAVKEVLGIDVAIATMVEELTKSVPDAAKAALPQLRAQLESPQSREMVRREAAKPWIAWVAEWTGRTIPEGRGVDATHPVACPDGTDVAAPTLYRRMPAESEGPGLVKLTRETTLDGDDAKTPFDSWLAKAQAATGQNIPATGMRLVDRVAVVTDPATLRPVWVRREEQRILHMKDLPDRTEVERHEYQFEWPAPVKPAEPATPADGGK